MQAIGSAAHPMLIKCMLEVRRLPKEVDEA
jgi:hypothetical protein